MMKMVDNNEDKSIRLEDLAQVEEVPLVEPVKLDELRRVYSPQEIMISQIPYELAKHYRIVPISLREDGFKRTITVVVADPQNNKEAIDYLMNTVVGDHLPQGEKPMWIDYYVRILTAPEDQIKSAIGRLYDEAEAEKIGEVVLPFLREMDELDEADRTI